MDDQKNLSNNVPVMNEGAMNENPTQQNNEVVFNNGAEQKNNKTPIIIVSIIAIMMAVVAAVFAYLYFTNMPDGSGGDEPDKEQSSEEQNADSDGNEGSGDVSRSEADIIEELKEKVGIILGKINDDNTIKIGRSIITEDMTLFSEGVIPMKTKIVKTLRSSKVKPIELSDDQISVIVADYSENSRDAFRKYLEEGEKAYDGNEVAKVYSEIFGGKIEHQGTGGIAGGFCPPYGYYSELNVYVAGMPGCGGMTAYNRQYYVYDNEVSDDAYVYVAAASSNGKGELLCDVYTYEQLNDHESINVCGSVSDPENLINSSNYQNFAKYRFVFNKADDGTYYFVKVEKL